TDGRLECLVCYNDENGPCLLADKELRFLIGQIVHGTKDKPKSTPPHLLTIFDCCHSGDNTRNGFLSDNDTRERRVKCVAPQRNWQDFIFTDDITVEKLQNQHLSQVNPEGIHVHLSACESDESALEVNGQGVFTSYLVNILKRARGNITYYDLMSQVRHYLNNTFTQKPQLRLPGEDSSGNYATFLNKEVKQQPLYGNVIYNHKNGWVLDMGSLMGISPKNKRVTITGPNQEQFAGKIHKILPDETRIKFRPADSPNKKQVYKATIEGLMAHPVKLFVNNHNGPVTFVKTLLEEFQNITQNIALEDEETNADYSLQIRDNLIYLTKPNDPNRPMVRPEKTGASTAISNVVNYLKHISNWEFVKRLKNAQTYLFSGNPVKVEAFSGGQNGTPLSIESNVADLHYKQRADGEWKGKVALKLTNTTNRKLYVSAMYLMIEFRVYLKGMEPQVYTLEPGESVWLFNYRKSEISYSVVDLASNYNWAFTEDFFKIIVSTTPFDVSRLEKKGLPKPPLISDDIRGRKKGLDIDEDDSNPELEGDDWTTQDLTLRFHNPVYNTISEKRLLAMLEDEDMAGFTARIFFEERDDLQLKLNPEIKIHASATQIKQLETKAFQALNPKGHQQRSGTTDPLPNLITLGDSWLHKDGIKNLSAQFSGYYNINRIKGTFEDTAGLTQALQKTDGKSIIISLGADEILAGNFDNVLQQLESWAKQFPTLKMIVHGYDYFGNGESKIAVDQFNEYLKNLDAQLNNLKHLDLRGTLNEHQWNNHTMPNDDGFEKLAGVFFEYLTN
ncbi:MAG: caspase family protein, partial [Bacteroidetes bacterium]